MNKKSLLAMIAVTLFACGSASAQFVTITPEDLLGSQPAGGAQISGTFQIGQLLGLNASDLTVQVTNGVASTNGLFFAVNDLVSTEFQYSGTAVEAFVQHGAILGDQRGGFVPNPQDGVSSTSNSFSLDSSVTSLDSNYTFGSSANDYFVEYTGPDNGVTAQNSTDFRFLSNGPVTNYTVFSNNTRSATVNNNFSTGVQVVSTIPEPSSAIVLALGGLVALRRKRS